jgi:putative ABC transport system substrate-binding protein
VVIIAAALVALLICFPVHLHAQDRSQPHRIGWLSLPATSGPRATFRDALRDLGYVEGKTVAFELRTADGHLERLPQVAAELVRARVDVIVAVAPAAIRAAKQTTTTIPIVMAFWGGPDLVQSGIIASFSRPGANITGVHMLASALDPKRMELLAQSLPNPSRIAILTHDGAGFEPQLSGLRQLAETMRLALHIADVRDTDDGYSKAFDSIVAARAEGLVVPTSPQFMRDRNTIVDLATRRRIPAIYDWGFPVHEGALMTYGASIAEMDRRAAAFVDRILRGAQPGSLPVEQPTKFELAINLKTARALGLSVPLSLLLRADQVIE